MKVICIKKFFEFSLSFLLLIFMHGSWNEMNAQTINPDSVSSGLTFKEGIYSTFEEFKNNKPSHQFQPVVLSPSQVTSYLKEHPSQLLISSSGQYIWVGHFTEDDMFVRIPPDSIWDYVKENEVYLKHQEYLVKLDATGALCHFTLQDAMFAEELNIKNDNEYFFEFETGKVKRFKLGDFLSVLQKKDMELYQKILSLDSYKKMRASMFEYLIEFNKRHPLTNDK